MSKVIYATVRDAEDEVLVECRFENQEKFAAITIDKKIDMAEDIAMELAEKLNNKSFYMKSVEQCKYYLSEDRCLLTPPVMSCSSRLDCNYKKCAKLIEHNFEICADNSLKLARIEYLEENLDKIKQLITPEIKKEIYNKNTLERIYQASKIIEEVLSE